MSFGDPFQPKLLYDSVIILRAQEEVWLEHANLPSPKGIFCCPGGLLVTGAGGGAGWSELHVLHSPIALQPTEEPSLAGGRRSSLPAAVSLLLLGMSWDHPPDLHPQYVCCGEELLGAAVSCSEECGQAQEIPLEPVASPEPGSTRQGEELNASSVRLSFCPSKRLL